MVRPTSQYVQALIDGLNPEMRARYEAANPQRVAPAVKRPTPAKSAPVPPQVHPIFRAALADAGLPIPLAEYRFAASINRKYRADYCWPHPTGGGVILEIDGGAYIDGGGRHNRGAGFVADMERNNAAVRLGYRLLRYPSIEAAMRDVAGIAAALRVAGVAA